MATRTIDDALLAVLREGEPHDGTYVLYWMQASQRAEHNPALEFAVQRANEHGVPLVVGAVVIDGYPDASARMYAFMLGGLGMAMRAIGRRGIRTCLRVGEPVDEIAELSADAVEVIVDRGYLSHQRRWYRDLADRVGRRITQVEGDVVVPVAIASEKKEHAARTIRPKINGQRDRFLVDLDTTPLEDTSTSVDLAADIALDELDSAASVLKVLERLGLDGGPGPVSWIEPGTVAARHRLDDFFDHVRHGAGYGDTRNQYRDGLGTSLMSPYLHFGQISPVAVALLAAEELADPEPFLEELIVRRELAVNYVFHEPEYASWSGLPEWARSSLDAHRDDERPAIFTAAELEAGQTDDDVWNAIMNEIRNRGWVHNQLRMYWGKQIVRWTNSPEYAFRTLLELNNRWFLDGRDASSYMNVGWCFGLHDQGFQERDVSGKLRPFTTAALKRKDDLRAWLSEQA